MQQRGRKSAASLAVVAESAGGPVMAPPGLSDAERGVWLATINSKPGDYFGTEHIPMLVEYVRMVCQAEVIDGQLKAFDPDWFATDDGLKRYAALTQMSVKVAGMVNSFARAMRLTHQSIYRAEKVIPKPGRTLWQREEPEDQGPECPSESS